MAAANGNRVGIIGAGRIGQAMARSALRGARSVSSSSRCRGLEWNGQIMIDATNDFDRSDLHGRTSSEVVADLVRCDPQ